MKKKILGAALALLMLLAAVPASAEGDGKVCLGGDLTVNQTEEAYKLLGVEPDEVTVLTLSHDEEKALLGDLVPAEQLGTRSMSCVSICPTEEGSGLMVTTKNITYCTETMYKSALATAGITDAEVVVACPVKVSGTAALAGIFKAYEASSGALKESLKEVAAQELVTTGELGEIIGKDDAAELISILKKKALEEGYDDPAKVREMVVTTAQEYSIELTEEQIDTITNLIVSIVKADIDTDKLMQAVDKINSTLSGLAKTGEKAKGFVASIQQFFTSLVDWVKSIFK